jgi:hypothetical protein
MPEKGNLEFRFSGGRGIHPGFEGFLEGERQGL